MFSRIRAPNLLLSFFHLAQRSRSSFLTATTARRYAPSGRVSSVNSTNCSKLPQSPMLQHALKNAWGAEIATAKEQKIRKAKAKSESKSNNVSCCGMIILTATGTVVVVASASAPFTTPI